MKSILGEKITTQDNLKECWKGVIKKQIITKKNDLRTQNFLSDGRLVVCNTPPIVGNAFEYTLFINKNEVKSETLSGSFVTIDRYKMNVQNLHDFLIEYFGVEYDFFDLVCHDQYQVYKNDIWELALQTIDGLKERLEEDMMGYVYIHLDIIKKLAKVYEFPFLMGLGIDSLKKLVNITVEDPSKLLFADLIQEINIRPVTKAKIQIFCSTFEIEEYQKYIEAVELYERCIVKKIEEKGNTCIKNDVIYNNDNYTERGLKVLLEKNIIEQVKPNYYTPCIFSVREKEISFVLNEINDRWVLNKKDFIEFIPTSAQEKKLHTEQISAIFKILNNGISVLIGPGGSGKTCISSHVNQHLSNMGEVWGCAPTNKAADIMRKNGINGSTIHSFILLAEKNNDAVRNIKFIIVDEASMLSFDLFYKMMIIVDKYCRDLLKIIFVGDIHQLKSVEYGNVLEDLTFFPVSELHVNHRLSSLTNCLASNIDNIRNGIDVLTYDDSFISIKPSGSIEIDIFNVVTKFNLDKLNSHFCCYSKSDADKISKLVKSTYNSTAKNIDILSFRKEDKILSTFNSKDLGVFNGMYYIVTNIFVTTTSCNGTIKNIDFDTTGDATYFARQHASKYDDIKAVMEIVQIESYRKITKSQPTKKTHKFSSISINLLSFDCKFVPGYASTLHQFQGEQTGTLVFFIGSSKIDHHFWYTLCTRAMDRLIIIGDDKLLSLSASTIYKRESSFKCTLENSVNPSNIFN
ncbi:MAG: hypothetical protein EOP34_04095 [Rickettsiales bacterium]|nr:MAG: hypothetical protein EOP34_04095 [Rickettsiales bacterium]